MKLEKFSESVSAALGDGLISLELYGSAATDERTAKVSDVNTLIVAETLEMPELKRLAETVRPWVKNGNPPPLLFTRDRLAKSADVFPIELLDMKERHKTILGEDVLTDLSVDDRHLQFQVEHELKGKLLHLRDAYLTTDNRPKRIAELLVRSLSTLQILFRAALRLYEPESVFGKVEAVARLGNHVAIDSNAFSQVEALKSGSLSIKKVDCEDLFERVLKSLSTVADAVDAIEH